jgi:nucleotide-binding universal stress UspA family protein
MNILVATDGSASSAQAVAEAAKLARQLDARVVLLNVVEPGHISPAHRAMAEAEIGGRADLPARPMALLDAFPGLNVLEAVQALESHTQAVSQLVSDRVLDEAERAAAQAGIHDVKKISAVGDAAQEIVKAAASMEADLVVVGRRGLGEVAELALGSVSQKVLHRAGRNVLVVS